MSSQTPATPGSLPSAICLIVDRLPAHLIGAYGNTWIRTPAFDALAAESLLCEFATIDSPRLELLYRSYWCGRHAASLGEESESALPGAADLPSQLRGLGIRTVLVTDEPAIAELPLAVQFDEIVRVAADGSPAVAKSVDATRLAQFFAAAIEAVEAAAAPSLVWLHCRGLAAAWDAPLELRNFYADEDDPEPPATSEIPNRRLAADHDPDERLGASQAAAGQVTAVDECLENLLGAIDDRLRRGDTLLMVAGARGFPLGEHLRLGPCDEALYEELVHVPLLVRLPQSPVPLRSAALVQSADVFATLSDWFHCERTTATTSQAVATTAPFRGVSLLPLAVDPQQMLRDRAVVVAGEGPAGEWSIRTPAWYLRHSQVAAAGEPPRQELFVKPDDRFEASDVARRCGEIVEQLTAAGIAWMAAAAANDRGESLAALLPHLVEGLD